MFTMRHNWHVPDLTQTAADPWTYLVRMRDTDGDRDVTFGAFVRAAREAKGLTQDELADLTGVSRTTISRWERGDGGRYEPDQVRAVFDALGQDIREAVVLLGFATRDQLGLPPEPPRLFDAVTEEAIRILRDPSVPDERKREWIEYLRYRTQPPEGRGRRRAS